MRELRRDQVPSGELGEHLQPVAEQHPGLVHLAPTVVGTSDSRVVRRERRSVRRARRSRSAPARRQGRLRRTARPRQRRARHLVLFRAVAVLHARLGRGQTVRRAERIREAIPAVLRAGHRLRHHLLLGGAHGDDDQTHHRQDSVQGRVRARPDPRRGRPEDVQVQGKCARPDRPHRRHRHRRPGEETHHRPDEPEGCGKDRETHPQGIPGRHHRLRHRRIAFHVRLAGLARPRHQVRHAALRRLSQLLQQAVERHALRADELRWQGCGTG